MSDVSVRLVRAALDLTRATGRTFGPEILNGFSFTEADLYTWGRRIPWDEYALLQDRLTEVGGGLEACERQGEQFRLVMPELRALAGAFLRPQHLYRFMFRTFTSAMCSNLIVHYEEPDDRRIEYEVLVPEGGRGCLPFYYGLLGAIRATPIHLGLERARVDATLSPKHGRYLIYPPPARTLLQRLRKRSAPEVAQEAADLLHLESGHVFEALQQAHATVGDQAQRMKRLNRLVERLAQTAPLATHAAELAALCTDELGCALAEIWVCDGREPVLAARKGDGASDTTELPLRVAGAEIGRLVLARVPRPELIEELLPTIALVVERARTREREPRPSSTLQDRYQSVQREWSLTPRQAEVLGLIIQGLSNKEIAVELECAERTVEVHVSELLRRSSCDSRSRLVSKYWSGQ
jgi:DNA-binding CsgD family transcriptional regulator